MFKALVIPLVALLGGHSQLEIKLDLFRGSEKIGFATYKESTGPKGHRIREMKFWARDGAEAKVRISSTKIVDANAFPISEKEEFVQDSGSIRSTIVWEVDYDKKNGTAIFTEFKDKVRSPVCKFPPIPGYSRADASDLWFNKVIPLPGTTVTSTVFDIEHAKWQIVETTYVGRRWITVGGRQIEANEVRDLRDGNLRSVYLDDKGQPVLMRNGPLRTEKHF